MNAARPDVAGLLRTGRLQTVPVDAETARRFDALRRRRNRSEYDDLLLSGTDVAADLQDALDIVEAAHAPVTGG